MPKGSKELLKTKEMQKSRPGTSRAFPVSVPGAVALPYLSVTLPLSFLPPPLAPPFWQDFADLSMATPVLGLILFVSPGGP